MRLVLITLAIAYTVSTASAAEVGPWNRLGPAEAGGFVAVDHAGEVVVAVDHKGAIWRSPDGGLSWAKALREPKVASNSSRELLQLEGAINDLGSEDDPIDAGDDLDDVPIDDSFIDGDLIDALDFLSGGSASGRAISARVSWSARRGVMVSRSDGLYLSLDQGSRWQQVSEESALALAPTAEGWVIARRGGLYQTDELGRFVHVLGTQTLGIFDLVEADGVTWAATTDGLWSNAGASWSSAGSSTALITDLLVDPGWEGGLWAVFDQSLQRTDDGGQNWQTVETPLSPLEAVWMAPGRLAVRGLEGVFATSDPGGWTLQTAPTSGALHAVNGDLIAVGPEGLFHSALARELANVIEPWIALNDLLHTALSRSELTASADASRVLRTLMPAVTTDFWFSPEESLDFNKFTSATTGGEWRASLTLKWTPAGRNGSKGQAALEELSLRADYDALGAGGDRSLLGAMGGRVTRSVAKQRTDIGATMIGLYTARVETERALRALKDGGVAKAVSLELRKRELEAKIDALTDGAVSAWNQNLE